MSEATDIAARLERIEKRVIRMDTAIERIEASLAKLAKELPAYLSGLDAREEDIAKERHTGADNRAELQARNARVKGA